MSGEAGTLDPTGTSCPVGENWSVVLRVPCDLEGVVRSVAASLVSAAGLAETGQPAPAVFSSYVK